MQRGSTWSSCIKPKQRTISPRRVRNSSAEDVVSMRWCGSQNLPVCSDVVCQVRHNGSKFWRQTANNRSHRRPSLEVPSAVSRLLPSPRNRCWKVLRCQRPFGSCCCCWAVVCRTGCCLSAQPAFSSFHREEALVVILARRGSDVFLKVASGPRRDGSATDCGIGLEVGKKNNARMTRGRLIGWSRGLRGWISKKSRWVSQLNNCRLLLCAGQPRLRSRKSWMDEGKKKPTRVRRSKWFA